MRNLLKLSLVFVLSAALASCAAPGSATEIPQPVAIAMAGGDVSHLPAAAWSAPPVRIDMHWYDRTWGIQVDRDGGGNHFADLTSTSSSANALEARRSDNQRAENITGNILGALQQGMALAAQAYAPALAARAAPPAGQADLGAVLEALAGPAAPPAGLTADQVVAVLRALQAGPVALPTAAPASQEPQEPQAPASAPGAPADPAPGDGSAAGASTSEPPASAPAGP